MTAGDTDILQVIELQELDSSLIHHFVTERNLNGLKEIVSQNSLLIDKRNEENQTPLHLACQHGYVAIVRFLLESGANVMARDDNEFTPLIAASRCGCLECVTSVFNYRQNLENVDMNGWSSLMWAVYKGHTDVTEYLLTQGANLHMSVAYNMTCLLWAAGRGYFNIVKLLCQKGAKVNHVDKFGNTPLLWASRRGYTNVVQCLLEHKADPSIVGANGCSSLINAVKGNYEDCLFSLLSYSYLNVNQTDRNGHTALTYAAKLGSVEITAKLLEHGAYLNLTDHNGDTPLIKAVKNGHVDTVKVLLSHFADVNIKGKDGKTAMHIACEMGQTAIIQELLKCNCKVDCANAQKETPLLRAVKEGNISVTKLLLNHGADVSAYDLNHDTCVHLAIRSQNLNLVELLLRNPKNARFLYQENKFGETPYDIEMRSNKKILSQLFGSKGFSTSAISNDPSFDTCSCSLAEMLTEPTLETPVCVGLYAKWGNDVEFLITKLKYQIELFAYMLPIKEHRLSCMTFFFIFMLSSIFGLFMAFIFFDRVLAGILSSFSLFFIFYFFIILSYLGSKFGKWEWAKYTFQSFQDFEQYLNLVFKISFFRHAEQQSGGKVRFIFAGPMNVDSMKCNIMMPYITSTLVTAVEHAIGKVAFRLARASPSPAVSGRHKWILRKFCCIPSLLLVLFFVSGLLVVFLLVIAFYGPAPIVITTPNNVNHLTIAMCVVSALILCTLFMYVPPLYNVFSSLLHSPMTIQRKIGCEEDCNRLEINNLVRAISVVDSINGTNTRICLLLNGLKASDNNQLIQLVAGVCSIYSAQSIITIVSIDYHLISAAFDNSSMREVQANDYIKGIIQLPVFLINKKQKKKFLKSLANYESDSDVEVHCNFSKRRKYPKHFDVTKWLTTVECFQPINPLLIKRVASIISFTARLLRSEERDFSWSNLSAWIVLTELWPYSTTCLICYIINRKIQINKSLKSIYMEIQNIIANNQSRDISDQQSLEDFITSKSCVLTVCEIMKFHMFTVNLDPKLADFIPNFNDCWTVHSSLGPENPMVSSGSNLSFDEVPLCDWSVEDVCVRIKSIPGLDVNNVQRYDSFVRMNNFHGLALSLCDVDELKKELHTSFGDWCLIKKFINETKMNLSKSKQVSFSSLAYSEHKLLESATSRNPMPCDDEEKNSHFSGLASSDRVAYSQAFKEYLKLQPTPTVHNNANNVIVHSHLDNERFPLLNNLDVNANS